MGDLLAIVAYIVVLELVVQEAFDELAELLCWLSYVKYELLVLLEVASIISLLAL